MKRILLLSLLLISIMIIYGCTSQDTKSEQTGQAQAEPKQVEEKVSTPTEDTEPLQTIPKQIETEDIQIQTASEEPKKTAQRESEAILDSWSQKKLTGYKISGKFTDQGPDGRGNLLEASYLKFSKYDEIGGIIVIEGEIIIYYTMSKERAKSLLDDTVNVFKSGGYNNPVQVSSNCFGDTVQNEERGAPLDAPIIICQEENIMFLIKVSGKTSLLSKIGTLEQFSNQLNEEIYEVG